MPGCPLRRTSTRPHEGACTAIAPRGELTLDLVVWWCTRSPEGAAEGCDLLILIFSNLQIAKAKSKDRPNAARTFDSPYRYFVICVPRNSVKNQKKEALEEPLFLLRHNLVRLAINNTGGVVQQALGRCLQERFELEF